MQARAGMARGARVPDGIHRLFPGLPAEALRSLMHGIPSASELGDPTDFVIGRLLEEGDSEDLRWLVETTTEERLTDWLARRGARQLSRRSHLFWRALLGRAGRPSEPPGGSLREALWPL